MVKNVHRNREITLINYMEDEDIRRMLADGYTVTLARREDGQHRVDILDASGEGYSMHGTHQPMALVSTAVRHFASKRYPIDVPKGAATVTKVSPNGDIMYMRQDPRGGSIVTFGHP